MGSRDPFEISFCSELFMHIKLPLPEGVDLKNLLEVLRSFSWGASDILKAYARGEQPPFGYSKSFSVQDADKGPVTSADLAVNNWLINGFRSEFPAVDWLVITEESISQKIYTDSELTSKWVWMIDPLDGTKDFIQGTGDYAMHIGLLYEGTPILGLVLIPEMDELWIGGIGLGSWCENQKGARREVFFGSRNELHEMILISSRNHRDNNFERLIEGINLGARKIKGSVGCKVVSILKGEADFYVSLSGETAPKDWDMAAPQAVLISAGGFFTHVDETALVYKTHNFAQKGCLIASNGKHHKYLCQELKNRLVEIKPELLM